MRHLRRYRVLCLVLLWVGMLALSVSAQTLSVRSNRWLEFRSTTGAVAVVRAGQSRAAQVGNRIRSVGDEVRTGPNSSARLAVDTQIGFVVISENTILRISRLRTTRRGGRVTELTVEQGQARLQVRSFTSPETELNIRTPAGVNGVRGTDFGVAIQPNGRTGVATLEGEVAAIAAGETVPLAAGLQSIVVPGESPDPPSPLNEDTFLDVVRLEWAFVSPVPTDDGGHQRVVNFQGRVDPINLLIINGVTRSTERAGTFDLNILVDDSRKLSATVITPLGTEQVYELAIP